MIDPNTIIAAAVPTILGAVWIGRQEQKINSLEVKQEDRHKELAASLQALDDKLTGLTHLIIRGLQNGRSDPR
jgi:hypothetical protein